MSTDTPPSVSTMFAQNVLAYAGAQGYAWSMLSVRSQDGQLIAEGSACRFGSCELLPILVATPYAEPQK